MTVHEQAAEGTFTAPVTTPVRIETDHDAYDEPLPADRFLDRELSWLAFNQRVLELSEDPDLPLLERARFLAIFASNLDEFFMVRVAGLKRRIATGLAVRAVERPDAPRGPRRRSAGAATN
jgi:polyphosphate kinase